MPVAAALSACQQPPPAVLTTSFTPDEERFKLLLDDREQAAVRSALRSVAAGHVTVEPPGRARFGKRWADLPDALASACNDDRVEVTIVETVKETDGDLYRFRLRTIEDWPGELVVRRAEGRRVYEVVEVWIGRFPAEPKHAARIKRLLDALEKYMKAYGRKRNFEEDLDQ